MSLLQRVTGPAQPPDLKGRTALLVGATSGVGEGLAHQLVDSGATLVLAGRDQAKLDALVNTLRSRATAPVHTVLADLADLNSIARACQEVHGLVTDLDLLIANAGVLYMGTQRQLTRQGFELTMGVNHLGNAAVALATEDLLRAATRARVVIVASEAHRRARGLPLDDLMGEHGFSGIRAYNRSKLANILFARELARHLSSSGVTVYSAHPGAVDTRMLTGPFEERWLGRMLLPLVRTALLTPAEAAKGIMRVAADPTLAEPSGSYFEYGRPNRGSELSNDPALARGLWVRTQQLLNR